jgi:predicted RNase H-like nuclease
VLAIDQPLVVRNETGRRPVEAAVSSVVGRYRGGVQPSSRVGRANLFGDQAPIWAFLADLAASEDPFAVPQARDGRFVFEVFPALGNLGLFPASWHRERCYKYNPANKTFSQADWRDLCLAAAAAFAALPCAGGDQRCRQLAAISPNKAAQDQLDALICVLHAHRFWAHGFPKSLLVGDTVTGYMVVPTHHALTAALRADAQRKGVPCQGG